MSRGPGRWQRAILDAVEQAPAGSGVGITHPDDSEAVQSAVRRAARQLEAAGKIALTSERVSGRPRLVAYAPEAAVPPHRVVNGLDGKNYRLPR